MTKKELQELKDGTLLYNGHVEGVIINDCGLKCIQVLIPIHAMNDDARHFDERPENWNLLDE